MEQKFEGSPKSEIRRDGQKLVRTDVSNDWGSLLRWVITQEGKVVQVQNARPGLSFEYQPAKPGKYEAVLELWKYVDYKKDAKGEFTNSKFIEISNKVTFTA